MSNTQKIVEKNIFFVDILKAIEEMSRIRIRIRNSVIQTRGSGSETLLLSEAKEPY
jgi:hypothetical protein